MSGNEDMIRISLDDTSSNGTDTNFRDELYGDASAGIGVFEIENELLEIFNAVNVVQRRR